MAGSPLSYRRDINRAVNAFRPVLQALRIREQGKHKIVRLARFRHLDLLDLHHWSIEVIPAKFDEKTCMGMFVPRSVPGNEKRIKNYIILSQSLYDKIEDMKWQKRIKIVGVHEFCHFIALVYAVTAVSLVKAREAIYSRLSKKIDTLTEEDVAKIEEAFAKGDTDEYYDLLSFSDAHFRLDCEGHTPDYNDLFLFFLFSKELLEEVAFTKVEQDAFRKEIENDDVEKAFERLLKCCEQAASRKWVEPKLAVNQLKKWVKQYL